MRSSSEIAAEIRALKAQMADGMPYGNSAAHNAAVFDHVFSGDHSGIDQYNRAVEQAIQNKLQREATAKQNDLQRAATLEIAKMGKAATADEQEITWRKDLALASNTLRQVKQQQQKGLADDFDVNAAEEQYKALVARGNAKGYANVPQLEVKETESQTDPATDPKAIRERYLAIINNPEGATDDDLAMAEQAAMGFMDADSVGKVKAIRAKRQEEATKKAEQEAKEAEKQAEKEARELEEKNKHEDDELIKVIDSDLDKFMLTAASEKISQIHDTARRRTYEDKLAKRRKAWQQQQEQKKEDAHNPFLH